MISEYKMAERLREVLDQCIRNTDQVGLQSLVGLLQEYRLAGILGPVLSAQDGDSQTQSLIRQSFNSCLEYKEV